MEHDGALASVNQILAEYFELVEEGIDPDANLADEYDIDSLQLLDLMLAVQERTGVVIPDEALLDVKTANDAAALLCRLVDQTSGA